MPFVPLLFAVLVLLTACSGGMGRRIEGLPSDSSARGYIVRGETLTLRKGRLPLYCGPEALCAVMEFWGESADVEQIARAVYDSGRGGTLPSVLLLHAQKLGFSAEAKRGSIGAIKNQIDKGILPIIEVRIREGLFHYFVVVGYSDREETVICLDYDGSRRLIGYSELEEHWAPTNHEMILVGLGTAQQEFDLGAVAERNGKWEEAVARYRKAVEREPRHVEARIGLGNCLRRMDRPGDALAAYEEALRLAPEDAAALNNFADLLLETDRDATRSEEMADRAVDRLQDDVTHTREELAKELREGERRLLVRELRFRELKLAYALGTLGEARFRNGRNELAAAAWKSSLDLFPLTHPDSRARRMWDLSRAHRALGMDASARDWRRQALDIARDPALRARIEKDR